MSCLRGDELVLYLEDRLEGASRGEMEEHLSTCRICRRRLVLAHEERTLAPEAVEVEAAVLEAAVLEDAVLEDLKAKARKIPKTFSEPPKESSRRQWAALAASLMFVSSLLFLQVTRQGPESLREAAAPSGETFRSDGASRHPLRLLTPEDGEVVEAERIEFQWTDLPEATRYTFTLLDELGDLLFRQETSEPRLGLDLGDLEGLSGSEGRSYWYVQAKLPGGALFESKARLLKVNRQSVDL